MKTRRKLNMNLKQIILLLVACFAFGGTVMAQEEYIYFDLAAGHVTIGPSSYTGYIFQTIGGETSTKIIAGSHNASNQYYVYQSQNTYSSATSSYRSTTGLVGATLESATMVIPTYDTVQITVNGHTRKWYDFITNQKDVDSVIDYWPSCAQAVYKTAVSNHIYVTGSSNYNVTIDGIWSSYNYASNNDGPIKVTPSGSGVTTLKVRGDNRIRNILWHCNTLNTAKLIITSYTGDGSKKGSLTVADLTHDHPADQLAVIGYHSYNNYGLWFSGATVFAGFPAFNNYVWRDRNEVKFPVCVGGGANGHGEVVITGGTLTAVSNGTTAAIGGGGGYNITGGYGLVTIKGNSHVYAYAHGIYSINSDRAGFVPTTAIGGASTFVQDAYDGTVVDISENAYVYAESVGGAAIGGGNARNSQGGGATINIRDNAHVESRSVSDVITIKWNGNWVSGFPHEYAVPVGSAMGGGVGLRGGAAEINISGSTVVEATSIGGGNAVTSAGSTAQYGGAATINISGGTTTVDNNIGGGHSTGTGNGGAATITVSAGTISASSVGGGDAISGNGGAATITMTGGTILDASVGGGNTVSGTGGNATISISSTDGPSLFRGGSIGGGDADNSNPSATPPVPNTATGNGGNASIYVTGGTLDCMSIGGGDSGTGTPGSVSHATRAGIQIEGSDKIVVKSGYIGGGSNTAGNLGKATVYINATHIHDTIQGQFVLCDNYSTPSNHCYFTMEAGLINNHGLEGIDGTHYPRKRLQGGAVYMEDPNGVVNISGGTIKRSGGTLGGAVYMTNGSFTLSGSAVIDSCYATSGTDVGLGGGVYMGGGEFTMTGGTMQRCMAPDKGGAVYLGGGTVNMSGGTVGGSAANTDMNTAVNAGGGIYMAGGSFTMTGGNLQYNKVTATDGEGVGTADGGGVYIASGGTANFHGGNIKGNEATHYGGGFYINPGSAITTLINSSSANMSINGNKAVNGGGAYIASGTVTLSEPSNKLSIYDNQARNGNGGGIYLYDGTFNLNGGQVGGYTSGETKYPGNKATFDTEGGLGGGIYLASGTFNLNGGTLGGVSVAEGPNTTMNQAYLSGGGLYMAGGTFEMNHGNLQYNKASGSGDSQGGGGVFLNTGGVAHIYGGHIIGNQAISKGGGLYVNPTNSTDETPITSTQDAIEISGNIAAYGAGAYIANGIVNVEQSGSNAISIHSNAASTNGGGFYLATGTFNLKSGVLGGSSDSNRNTAAYHGGGLYIAGGAFTMTGGSLQYNKATTANTSNGGGVYIASGLATINGGNISNNQAANYGGGFYVNPSSAEQTTIINSNSNNTVISGNTALLGGGAYINNGILAVAGSSGSYTTTVKSNSATGTGDGKGRGGAFYVAAGSANIAHAFIGAEGEANTATVDGGGIYAIGPVTLGDGAMVQSNTATQNGGGVYVNNATFTMNSGSTLGGNAAAKGNSAANGGGVYVTGSSASVSLVSGSAVQYNTASTSGGGVYANQGTVGITSATIDHNSASASGGGVYAKGTVTLTTPTISNNSATASGAGDGGGVYVASGGTLSLTGGTVTTNTATRNGGGFYVNPGSSGSTPITNANLSSNTATNDGGGAYVATGTVTLTGATLNGNTATNGNGGGLWASSNVTVSSSTITNNVATNSTNGMGGGVYTEGANTVVTLDRTDSESANTVLKNNQAHLGGGVYTAATITDPEIQYVIELKYVTVGEEDHANTATANGGGIYAAGPVNVSADAVVQYNTATENGGGIFVGTGGNLNLLGDLVHNTATLDGGGAYVMGGAATVTNASVTDNTASQDGGGVYVSTGGTLTVEGGSVSTNTATRNGGGFYVNPGSGTTYIKNVSGNTLINANEAVLGAGAYVASGSLDVNGSTSGHTLILRNNHASASGGATYVAGGSVSVTSATIGEIGKSNTATTSGGGIYAAGSVTLNDGALVQCNTSASGGGVYVDNGSFTMNSGSTLGGSDVTYANTATNGGGAYVTGSSASVSLLSGSVVRYNTASASGGGVYAAQGSVGIAGTVDHNSATTSGGGLYAAGNVTLNSGALVQNNTSVDGGGVYVNNGSFTMNTGSTLGGSDVSYANTASQSGGGVYVNGSSGLFTMNGGTIQYNQATALDGGGFYIHTGGKANIYGGSLLNNTAGRFGGGGFVDPDSGAKDPTVTTINSNEGNTLISGNSAPNGGGIYVASGSLAIAGSSGSYTTQITGNSATQDGGGAYTAGGAVTVEHAVIGASGTPNIAGRNGGGIYASGAVTLNDGALVQSNTAVSGGGVYVNNGTFDMTSGSYLGGAASTDGNIASQYGGGAYIAGTSSVTLGSGSLVKYNTAYLSGGGVYTSGGTVTLTGATVAYNTARDNDGGGIYSSGGSLTANGSTIDHNNATSGNGGGAYAAGGSITVQKNGGTSSSVTNNRAISGGALYAAGGSVTLTSATVSDNHATTGNGGAVCAAFTGVGSVTIEGGTISSNATDNTTDNGLGGAIYVSGNKGEVNIRVDGSSVAPTFFSNRARDGGVLYMNDGTCNITAGKLGVATYEPATYEGTGNTASRRGGGIYAAGGTINFSDGTIGYNYAAIEGGGIYLADGGTINMKHSAEIQYNHVPKDQQGGGIYMDGNLNLGENWYDNPESHIHRIKVETNYAATSYDPAQPLDSLNNVFLKDEDDIITLKSDISSRTEDPSNPGHYIYDSHIGFSVNSGFRAVVGVDPDNTHDLIQSPGPDIVDAGALNREEHWLNSLMGLSEGSLNSAIFDDIGHYIAIHSRSETQDFHWYYIYLWSGWNTGVTEDPHIPNDPGTPNPSPGPGEDPSTATYHIRNEEDLSWFTSLVNGLNGNTRHPYINGIVEADLDMAAYLWVPIGSVTSFDQNNVQSMTSIFMPGGKYCGTFDGQGHTIRNLECRYIVAVSEYGLFGNLKGATVKDVYVDDFIFESQSDDIEYHIGGIAGTADSTVVISNCEANGTINVNYCDANSSVGGLVGKMVSTTYNPPAPAEPIVSNPSIHSSMSLTDIVGKAEYVGGLVGYLDGAGASVKNSFTNSQINVSTLALPPEQHVGGLAGRSNGVIENCYAIIRDGSTLGSTYGSLVALNSGSVSYSYAYCNEADPSLPASPSRHYTEIGSTGPLTQHGYFTNSGLVNGKYGFDYSGEKVFLEPGSSTPPVYGTYVTATTNGTPTSSTSGVLEAVNGGDFIVHGLQHALNAWVAAQSTPNDYSTWMRTMGCVNDDYPVLKFNDFTCLGSKTGSRFIEYKKDITSGTPPTITKTSLDQFIEEYNLTADGGNIYPFVFETEANSTRRTLSVSTEPNVRVFLRPNWAILQASDVVTRARVGVAFDNSDAGWLGGKPYDWHMFSSALDRAPLGIKYNTEGSGYTPAYGDNPPVTGWYQSDDPAVTATYDPAKVGYFPTDTPYGHPYTTDAVGSFDLYCYYEPLAHWINFKRNSDDHWHSTDHYNFDYTNEEGESGNEDHFINGKGYLAAVSKTSVLMADGTLNNGDISIKTSYTNPGAYYGNDLNGINLIGNPYLSYLDFDKFVQNGEEWTSCPNVDKVASNAYYILDADQQGYIGYTFDATPTGVQAPRFIHPHQGILIKVDSPQTLTFKEGMRSLTGNETSYFRGEQNVYPLVSMTCTDSEGKNDFATIELNRPEAGGGEKIKGLHAGNASIWFHCDQSDWFVAFTTPGIQEAPLRFQAYEDGVFTLTWSPENAEFSYLHLIDNITGSDVDCLATDKYVFEGRVTDYTSRFRLVFEYNDENDDEEEEESETFAFMMGDELVVNGEGVLQVFDVLGRQIMGKEMQGIQSTVILPVVADGVYVLRLTTGSVTKTQKLVINK